MNNPKINIKNLFTGLGFILLFFIFCKSDLKADVLDSPQKNKISKKNIKWVKFYRSNIDKNTLIKKPSKSTIAEVKGIDPELNEKVVERVEESNQESYFLPSSKNNKKNSENIFLVNNEAEEKPSKARISEIIIVSRSRFLPV